MVGAFLVAAVLVAGINQTESGAESRDTTQTPATMAKAERIGVSPAAGRRTELFTVRAPAPYPLDHPSDAYAFTLAGPGGKGCDRRQRSGSRIRWRPRDNARHRERGVSITYIPHRLRPTFSPEAGPGDLDIWCPGVHRGRVFFDDAPRGSKCPRERCVRARPLGRFSFRVHRGPATVTVPTLAGRSRHEAECTLRRRELRWRFTTDQPRLPNRFHPLPGCQRRVKTTSVVGSQQPVAGERVDPGTVVLLELRAAGR